jgi:hypothetical protein
MSHCQDNHLLIPKSFIGSCGNAEFSKISINVFFSSRDIGCAICSAAYNFSLGARAAPGDTLEIDIIIKQAFSAYVIYVRGSSGHSTCQIGEETIRHVKMLLQIFFWFFAFSLSFFSQAHIFFLSREATMASTATTTATTTLGMQLDAALAQLDSLSSTQLYVLIVFVTVLISSVLLGNAQPTELVVVDDDSQRQGQEQQQQQQQRTSPTNKMMTTKSSSSDTSSSSSSSSSGSPALQHLLPEPRWYLFRIVNYAMMVAFCASVVAFSLQFAGVSIFSSSSSSSSSASSSLLGGSGVPTTIGPTTMLQLLVGWSMFLIYFFGFFGVSFVHDNATPTSAAATVVATSTTDAAGTTKTTDNMDPSCLVHSKKAAAMTSSLTCSSSSSSIPSG